MPGYLPPGRTPLPFRAKAFINRAKPRTWAPVAPIHHERTTRMRLPPKASALLPFALLLPLAACDKGPTVAASNATQAEVQEKVAAAGGSEVMVQPGRWEGAMTIEEMDVPNMPAEAKAQMKAQAGGPKPFISCVTEEDVKTQKAFFTAEDKNCKYDRFVMAGGKVAAVMNCDQGGGAKMHMEMNGTYSADEYQMRMSSKVEGGNAPMGAMSMKMAVAAKRTGQCKGTPDEL